MTQLNDALIHIDMHMLTVSRNAQHQAFTGLLFVS